MLLTCTPAADSATPATDLGFLLHKNPDRVQEFGLSFGTAHVLYPEAAAQRCSAATARSARNSPAPPRRYVSNYPR